MSRPVSHPATGRRFDCAEEQPAEVIQWLAELHLNLPARQHGLICETAQPGHQAVYVYKPGGRYQIRHFPGGGHNGNHDVNPESDEHKWGKEYHAAEFDRFGIPAGTEVKTDNHTKHDAATLDAPRITAVEFQAYNRLGDREYKRRTTLAMRATAFVGKHARPIPGGVLPLWVHAFGMPRDWAYAVPSIAAQDTRWDAMPKPGSVTAIGVRSIEAEPCRSGSRWQTCPIARGRYCGQRHPLAVLRLGLRTGEVAAMAASGQLVPLQYHTGAVYLVTPADAALYAELGGEGVYTAGAAVVQKSRKLLGHPHSRHHQDAVAAPVRKWFRSTQARFRRERDRKLIHLCGACGAVQGPDRLRGCTDCGSGHITFARRSEVERMQERIRQRQEQREAAVRAMKDRRREEEFLARFRNEYDQRIRRMIRDKRERRSWCEHPGCHTRGRPYLIGTRCDQHTPARIRQTIREQP